MTSQPPRSTARPRMTLDQIATAAARLIADARAAGLAPPCALNCHDFGPPTASLYVTEHDAPQGIWPALRQWASHHGTEVTTHPATSPGEVRAVTEFHQDGIRYQVSSLIHAAPGDDAAPAPRDQA